jgi:hypothetical protein
MILCLLIWTPEAMEVPASSEDPVFPKDDNSVPLSQNVTAGQGNEPLEQTVEKLPWFKNITQRVLILPILYYDFKIIDGVAQLVRA